MQKHAEAIWHDTSAPKPFVWCVQDGRSYLDGCNMVWLHVTTHDAVLVSHERVGCQAGPICSICCKRPQGRVILWKPSEDWQAEQSLKDLKTDASSKDFRNEAKKLINTRVGQISATWSRIQEQCIAVHMYSHLKTIREPRSVQLRCAACSARIHRRVLFAKVMLGQMKHMFIAVAEGSEEEDLCGTRCGHAHCWRRGGFECLNILYRRKTHRCSLAVYCSVSFP